MDRLPLTHAPTGDTACNPGIWPDRELNQQHFTLQDDGQSHTGQGATGVLEYLKVPHLTFNN